MIEIPLNGMCEITFSGMCKECPYADLKFSVDNRMDTYAWYISCENRHHCLRAYRKGFSDASEPFEYSPEEDDGK